MKISSLLEGKKRYLAATVAAATFAGGAFAFADSLSLSSASLGANKVAVTGCGDTLSATYTTSYDSTASLSGYKVTKVTISGVTNTATTGCAGKAATLELTGASGGLASASVASLAVGSNDFSISGVIDAQSVTGLSAVVTG